MIAVEIRPRPGHKIIVISAYRSQTDPSPQFLSNLDEILTNAETHGYHNFLILGDLNYPEINWIQDLDLDVPYHCKELLALTKRYDFNQFNFNPSTIAGNILDVVMSNLQDKLSPILSRTYPYRSDHYLLEFNIEIEVHKTKSIPRSVFNFKRGNMDQLRTNIGLICLTQWQHAENKWYQLKKKMMHALDQHIPKIRITNKKSPPWIDIDVIQMSKQKHKALKKSLKTNNNTDRDNYKAIRNRLKNLVTSKYKGFINNIAENLATKQKKCWSLLASRTKGRGSPGHLKEGDHEITDSTQKANLFNRFFGSIFAPWNKEQLPNCQSYEDENLRSLSLEEQDIRAALKNLDPTKAPGPDGIPTSVLKDCSEELIPNLTNLFNASLTEGLVPQEWKEANVVPVLKEGDPTNPSNYRPISLLPVISKLLERCIYDKIITYLRPKITSMQHGFLTSSSTTTQLLTFFNNINDILDHKHQCDVIYFDISKAFDSVPHPPLLAKLKSMGICGSLHKWFTDYLTNRMQRVTLDGRTSEWLPVTSGVPQGSILGPLLFLLYINDLPTVLSPDTFCAIFADDTKIGRKMTTVNDSTILQNDINNMTKWGDKWGLKFNQSKCKILYVHKNPDTTIHNYTIGDAPLNRVQEMEDLGIIVASNLKWGTHINKFCKKARKQLGLITRTLSFQAPILAKRTACIAMIRSIIEYGSSVWSPKSKAHLKEVERIQRKMTNYILCNPRYDSPNHIDYKTRLISLNLLPTAFRREIIDITLLLKSIHNKTNLDLHDYIHFCDRDAGPRTRSLDHQTRLVINKTRLISTSNFFPYRICRIWNKLPIELRLALRHTHNPLVIKQHLIPYYRQRLVENFDPNNQCTWISWCDCGRCSL